MQSGFLTSHGKNRHRTFYQKETIGFRISLLAIRLSSQRDPILRQQTMELQCFPRSMRSDTKCQTGVGGGPEIVLLFDKTELS